MKKWFLKILLLLFYCIPFVFLAVNGDAVSGTMRFYILMVIGFAVLCCAALKTDNLPILYIGNGLSFISSRFAAKLSGLEPMGGYFKPFTSDSLLIAISVAAILCQTIPVIRIRTGKRKEKHKTL